MAKNGEKEKHKVSAKGTKNEKVVEFPLKIIMMGLKALRISAE